MSSEPIGGASPDGPGEDSLPAPEQTDGFSSPAPEAWGQPAPDSWGNTPQTPQPTEFASPAPDPWPGPQMQQPTPAGSSGPSAPESWTQQDQPTNQFPQGAAAQSPTDQFAGDPPGQSPSGQIPPGPHGPGQFAPGGQFPPGQYPAGGQFAPGGQYPPGAQYPPGGYSYQPQYFTPAVARNNPLAIVALVCGICQVVLLIGNVLLALPAIICGSIALRQIAQRGQRGRGMAIAGLVLGILGVLFFFLLVVVGLAVTERTGSGFGAGSFGS